ncbi:acyl-CoA thioesterase [Demequina iriomotensis]|uniref:acyl-CoA thioesterase n=1 Tax=Demequina iriomotensis TaxID=1536641 RepID=UPI000782BFE1|nr:acyl-CoA thioesterase [Demequina iriomotensis]
MPRLTVPVDLRFSDLDLNGHVNNVAFLTILEEVRIRALHPLIRAVADTSGALRRTGSPGVVVARHEVEYLAQMPWSPEPILVDLWVPRVGGSSCEVHHVLRSGTPGEDLAFAQASTVLVYLDPATQRSRRLTDAERAAFTPVHDAPLRFRHATVPA